MAVATVVLVLVVPLVTAGWVLWLALAAFFLGGGEWGLFGEQPVDASWWADAIGIVALVAGVVLVVAICVGLPVLLGLHLRDARRELVGEPRPRRRLPRVVLAAATGSFGVLTMISVVLYLMAELL